MKIEVDGLEVYFPFDGIYPEQLDMMLEVKKCLDARGHALIECPTGTGKTVALLSLITAYQFKYPQTGKLIYATRTVPEMTKCVEELKLVLKTRRDELGLDNDGNFLGVCLSSRKNMCINPDVIGEASELKEDGVDVACRRKIAPWVRQQHGRTNQAGGAGSKFQPQARKRGKNNNNETVVNQMTDPNERDIDEEAGIAGVTTITTTTTSMSSSSSSSPPNGTTAREGGCPPELCSYYENYIDEIASSPSLTGVFTLDDMQEEGKRRGWCPYFTARYAIEVANVVVYNFSYLLDPKVANLVSKSLPENAIVVFDECHNVDNVCIEALSVNLNKRALDAASANLASLRTSVERMKSTDKERLTREYEKLLKGLSAVSETRDEEVTGGNVLAEALSTETVALAALANPTLPEDILNEAVPGPVRKAEQFVQMMGQVVTYLKQGMDVEEVKVLTPSAFVFNFERALSLDSKLLRFAHGRLDSLLRTLQVVELDTYAPLTKVADFLTLVATPSYRNGFMIVTEPYADTRSKFRDPVMQLACLDASIAIKPVFSRFQSVIITSGTLSPIELYPKLLNFSPVVTRSLSMTMSRPCILPIVVARGNDQTSLTSNYESKEDLNVCRNYGELLIETCATVPDGVVCFFTAYERMERYVTEWESSGILNRVLEHKLIFIETKDIVETTLALDNYRRACDNGRGAVFFSVARGKVSEGVDFERHYGRAVVLFGVPYQYTESRILKERLVYLRANFGISENDFLTFDAVRSASQCLGRVLRSKQDWGIMVLADHRYNHPSKRKKLPSWITQFLQEGHTNLAVDEAVHAMRKFLRAIAQPVNEKDRLRGKEVMVP